MNENEIINNSLTIFDRDTLWYHEGLPESIVIRAESDVFVAAKLSKVTRQIMERHYAKLARKKKPRKPTKAKGRYHWKRKEGTRLRRAAARWANNPLGCLINGRGCWQVDRSQWDTHIAPLWMAYPPEELRIKKRWGYGTVEKPYTIYDLKVFYIKADHEEVAIFDGDSLKLYELSSPQGTLV